MKKLTEQEKKDLTTLDANIKKHDEQLKEETKRSHEDFTLKRRENNLLEYVDNLVVIAERNLRELKDYQHKVNDESYTEDPGKEKVVQWAMNYVQQINWHFDDGADVIMRYAVAKTNKEFSRKQS